MTIQATNRNIRRTFTLSAEAVAFGRETRRRRGAASDSEALNLLLHEAMLEEKRHVIDAACREYYDTTSDEDLAEQREWAEVTGPNLLIETPNH